MGDAIRRHILVVARYALGGAFVYASIDKLAFPSEFTVIVRNYQLVSENLASIIAQIIPWLELSLGILLIAGVFVRGSATVLSGFLTAFMVFVILKSRNGFVDNCGCFGLSSGSQPLAKLLVRNAVLLSIGGILVLNRLSLRIFKKCNGQKS